jgi:ribosome-associated protein
MEKKTRKKRKEGLERAGRFMEWLQERKPKDMIGLDVRGISSFGDCFLIVSGRSTRQVKSMAEHLLADAAKAGIRPLGVEGLQEGQWVLMDYEDVIVHIFYEPLREYYDLEGLWADAPKIRVEP